MSRISTLVLFLAFGLFLPVLGSGSASAQSRLIPTTDTGATITGSNGGLLCLGCRLSDVGNVVAPDLSAAAIASVPVGLGSGVSITVGYGSTVDSATNVGFRLEALGGLADVQVLSSLRLTTFLNGQYQESAGRGTPITLALLKSGSEFEASFSPTAPFDAVRIEFASLASVLTQSSVYYAFADAGPTSPGGNEAPDLEPDSAVIAAGSSAVLDVLANDSDPDGDALLLAGVSSAVNGTATVVGDKVLFAVDATATGTASFQYSASDGKGATVSAMVSIVISAGNSAPTIEDDEVTTDEDQPVLIRPLDNDSDPNGGGIRLVSVTAPSSGTVTINGDVIRYTPAADVHGTVTFAYTAQTSGGTIGEGLVEVAIRSVNDAPTAPVITSPSPGAIVSLDAGAELLVRWNAATDADRDALSYGLEVSLNANGSAPFLSFSDVGSQADLSYATLQAIAAAAGAHSHGSVVAYFTVTVFDGTVSAHSDQVAVTIAAPRATSDEGDLTPATFALAGNAPNPFSAATSIVLDLPEPAQVTVEVFDVRGRQVIATDVDVPAGAGQRVPLSGLDTLGPGVYLYRVLAVGTDTYAATGRMTRVQ